ncbi:RimJ/RimL family protein N-acetyltransferase [Jatrophihabitans sp. GAS493]|uniref:GNAT family N-acetyltransferase n=1 Tax=Jatrophihabitans sp. GAS493 TaxID=1907575 RepID=UPI000BB96029|nr:GNAT family N-acetyltransferase [Jatrophihabitans sp. GAS493]SOD72237.1 RimJ/RimL family protein N-acetyltransferase [Jatrophihabitans sp. GAS493]
MTYPSHWEADVLTADGARVHLRPITAADADRLTRFHATLSLRTRYRRYFNAMPYLSEQALFRFTNVDYHYRVALIVLVDDEIVAVGRYEGAAGSAEAEVAFVVADAYQGHGLGSVLLDHLAAAALECGITRFTATVLADNHGMLRVFTDAGYQVSSRFRGGEVDLWFEIADTQRIVAVRADRAARSAGRSQLTRRPDMPPSTARIEPVVEPDNGLAR